MRLCAPGAAVAVVFVGLTELACGRHVVLDPGDVVRSNDQAWTILAEPAADAGHAPAPFNPPQNPP